MMEARESILYQQLGNTIRGLRQKHGIKQEDLASQVGLSRASIVNIEKGRHRPQLHILYELATVFQCDVCDLLPLVGASETGISDSVKSQLRPGERGAVAQLLTKAKRGGR